MLNSPNLPYLGTFSAKKCTHVSVTWVPHGYHLSCDTTCSPILSNVLRIGIIDTAQSSGVGVIEVYINLMTIDILRRKDVFDQ